MNKPLCKQAVQGVGLIYGQPNTAIEDIIMPKLTCKIMITFPCGRQRCNLAYRARIYSRLADIQIVLLSKH